MADVRINLIVDSNGTTARETILARKLADEFKRAAEQALRIRVNPSPGGNPPPGGGPPVPPWPTPRPSPSNPRPTPTPGPIGESAADAARRRYNETLGMRGTGASATSDFARQASGLGGLVHVYATFAANIFAVGAAFRALSQAADTSNMIKGLDQLGAASGKNLNNLSKQLVGVTEGAISMKDAMTATAMAASGGIAGADLLRIGNIARNASQALGRDMPDALSRLSRGIIKIEPELLDELGIMVKVNSANIEYARSLGKTASSLTDLEKRHAFANAVITQGEKKFSDINMAPNPYTKITASVTDLSFSLLNLANKFLSPVVDLLSQSPTALLAVIGSIAAMLVRQAIPAIGQWRDRLAETAIQARSTALASRNAFNEFRTAQNMAGAQNIARQVATQRAAVETQITALRASVTSGIGNMQSATGRALAAGIANMGTLTQQQTDRLTAQIRTFESKAAGSLLRANAPAAGGITPTQQYRDSQRAIATEQQARADSLRQSIAGFNTLRNLNAAEREETRRAEQRQLANQNYFSGAAARERAAARADRIATRAELANNAAQNTQTMGVRGAISTGVAEAARIRAFERNQATMTGQPLTLMQRGLNNLNFAANTSRVVFSSATAAVSGFMGALMPWIMVIGLVVGALKFLYSKLSENTKQMNEFDSAVEALGSNTDLLSKTIDNINKKGFMESLSIESIEARTNSLSELGVSLATIADKFNKVNLAAGATNKAWDFVSKLWGGDVKTEAIDKIAPAILAVLKETSGGAKDTLESTLKSTLGITEITSKSMNDALSSIDPSILQDKFNTLSEAINLSTKSMITQSAALTNLRDQLKLTAVTSDAIITSLTPTDNEFKFASNVIKSSDAMAKALLDPKNSAIALNAVLKDASSYQLFSPAMQQEGIAYKKILDEQVLSLGRMKKELLVSDALAARLDKGTLIERKYQAPIAKQKSEDIKANIVEQEAKMTEGATPVLSKMFFDSFTKGGKLLEVALKNASQTAAIDIAKAATAGLSGPGTAEVVYKLSMQDLNIQMEQLKVDYNMLQSQKELSMQLEHLANVTAAATSSLAIKDARDSLAKMDTLAANSTRIIDSKYISPKEEASTRDANANTIKTENANLALNKLAESALEAQQKFVTAANKISNVAERKKFVENSAQGFSIVGGPTGAAGLAAANTLRLEMSGVESKMIAIQGKMAAAGVTKDLAVIAENLVSMQKALDFKKAINDLDASALSNAQGMSNIYSSQIQDQRLLVVEATRKVELAREVVDIEASRKTINVRQKATGFTFEKQKAQDAIDADRVATLSSIKYYETVQSLAIDTANRELAERERVQSFITSTYNTEATLNKLKITDATNLLTMQQSLNQVSAEYAINETARLAIKSSNQDQLNTAYAEQVSLARDFDKIETDAENRKKALPKGSDTTEIDTAKDTALNARAKQYTEALVASNALNDSNKLGAKYIQDSALELAKQAKLMTQIESIGTSLTKVFGKVGTAIGSMVKGAVETSKTLKAIEQKRGNDQKKLDEDKLSTSEQYNKLDREAALETASVKMGAAADAAGAIGDSFDQQGSAARAFHFLEKAFHMAKLAMDIEAMVSSVTVAGLEGVLAASVATSWIPAVWARAFGEAGPYAGWALGAAAVAMIGLGSHSGSSASFSATAEQQQKVQGSGSGYNTKGEVVATGGGALGDISAISKAVENGISNLEKTNYELLSFNKDKMYDALVAIRDNTAQFAKALVTTTGITGGTSAFGTTAGSSKSALGFGSSSTDVTDTGITIAGALKDLMAGGGTKQQYENVHKESSSWWGLSSSSSNQVNTKALSESVNQYVSGIFTGFNDAMKGAAETFGMSANDVVNSLTGFNISIKTSAKGLTSAEFAAAVMAEIGIQLDKAAEQSFPALAGLSAQFQNLGESTFEFVTRLAADTKNVKLAMDSIGKSFTYTGVSAIQVSESILKSMGGLDAFTSAMDDFKSNFLSTAEQLVPTQKAVTSELARLGLSSIDTREKFKDLVLATDPNSDLFVSLLKLEKSFAAVYEASDIVTLSAKELAAGALDQLIRVMELLDNKTGALNATRAKELKAMDARLVPMQKWVYALEDETTARDELNTAYNTERDTRQALIDSTIASSASLKDFMKSLDTGALSTMTPAEKYQQAKESLSAVTDVLNNSASTTLETNAALAALPNAISSMLETSKVFNASSAAYQEDYSMSKKILQDNVAKLDSQVSTAEASLAADKKQVDLLGGLDKTAMTIAEGIAKLTAAMVISNNLKIPNTGASTVPSSSIPGYAIGGMASGLSIVGEKGPELVNFGSPGMVTTASSTANIFSTFGKEMSSELKMLREEVATLRAEANRNATMMANSNIYANREAANQVSEAFTDSVSQTTFNTTRNMGSSF